MIDDPDYKSLSAVVVLKGEARRARLLEKAKGRGLFSWMDVVFALLIVGLAYVAFSGRKTLQLETLVMAVALIMIVQWSVIRLTMRLNALVQFFIEQPARQDAQQSSPTDTPDNSPQSRRQLVHRRKQGYEKSFE